MPEIAHYLPYFGLFLVALIALSVLWRTVVGELGDLETLLRALPEHPW